MPIYKVNWGGHCYVKAENLRDAQGILRREVINHYMSEEAGLESSIDPTPVKSLEEVSPEWRDCIPFGGSGCVTLEDEFSEDGD